MLLQSILSTNNIKDIDENDSNIINVAVYVAFQNNYRTCMTLLSVAIVDIDIHNTNGNILVFMACEHGDDGCISHMIENGVDVNKQNRYGTYFYYGIFRMFVWSQ